MVDAERSEADIKKSLERGRVLVPWRLLRTVGNSRAAKLTILIPLVGYLILLNDDIVAHLSLSKDVFGDAADATLTRLLSVYVGLVFIAVASVVFAIWCPREVKRYGSPEEYVAGDEPFLSEREVGMVQSRLKIGDTIAREDNEAYNTYHDSRPIAGDLEEHRRRARQLVRIQLNLLYEMLDRSRRVARWAAAICYALGFVFMSVPSALVFGRVLVVLGRKVYNLLG
jgi:hypothetical protein